TVGRGPLWVRSWVTAFTWVMGSKRLVDMGYYEHKHRTKIGAFQIPTLSGNHVLICGDKLVDEFRNAPSSTLSFAHATSDILQAKHTIGTSVLFEPFHVPFVREQLTRHMDAFTIPMMEEFSAAMEEHMDLKDDEWKPLVAYDLCAAVIARGMSRIFVGTGLCRNKEYLAAAIDFTQNLFIAAHLLYIIPGPLKYIAAPFINAITVRKQMKSTTNFLTPMIDERRQRAVEEGPKWAGRPDDMLQWIIEGAPSNHQDHASIILRMMEVNMSGLHTAGITLYQNLFSLALYPQHITPLRNEITATIAQYGWNKASINKLMKLDSFMKESQRLSGPSVAVMGRGVIAKEGFTFKSNGLHLPMGTRVSIPETVHFDPKEYGSDASEFDGFRFSRPLEEQAEGGGRKYFVTTGLNYLRFGHGHGACPGRFYASHEIKIILCILLMNYDIRLEDVPRENFFSIHRLPDLGAQLAFRKRQVV
ncbi:cytochrome P450, partial [Peziza echinospora]